MTENNTNTPEENKMSLSEALNMLINLRNACNFLGLKEYVTALETVYGWVSKMVAFFYDTGRKD